MATLVNSLPSGQLESSTLEQSLLEAATTMENLESQQFSGTPNQQRVTVIEDYTKGTVTIQATLPVTHVLGANGVYETRVTEYIADP